MKLLYCPRCMSIKQLGFMPSICACGRTSACYIDKDENNTVAVKGIGQIIAIPNHLIASCSKANEEGISEGKFKDDLGQPLPCWFLSDKAASVIHIRSNKSFSRKLENHGKLWLSEKYQAAGKAWEATFLED